MIPVYFVILLQIFANWDVCFVICSIKNDIAGVIKDYLVFFDKLHFDFKFDSKYESIFSILLRAVYTCVYVVTLIGIGFVMEGCKLDTNARKQLS